MPIRCVTFDLDDTLWPIYPAIERAEKAFHQWLSQHLPALTDCYSIEEINIHRLEFYQQYPEMHHDLTHLRKRWLTELLAQHKDAEYMVEEGFRVFSKERNNVALFEHVHDILTEVSGRYICGAITNGNADINQIGIGHYFDFVVTAANVGKAKPHPDIFAAALRYGNCEPHEMVHVGDDPVADIEGAATLGIRTVWVNTPAREWQGNPIPDDRLTSLAQLPAILERLNR